VMVYLKRSQLWFPKPRGNHGFPFLFLFFPFFWRAGIGAIPN
jgi:hypothetical protein